MWPCKQIAFPLPADIIPPPQNAKFRNSVTNLEIIKILNIIVRYFLIFI